MRYFIFMLLSIGFLGCSGEQMAHSITKAQIAMSGNKPPASYRVANIETMRDYVFQTKDFSFSFPSAKQSDFTTMEGWFGASHGDGKTITLHLHPVYHITVGTSRKIREYTERERAIVNNDMEYLRTRFPKKTRKGKKYNTNVRTIRGGKENYPCIVRESYHPKYEKRKISYGCFKVSPSGAMVKGVGMTLTYNKPKNPTLAKQYTYTDLKRRAKRVLDSLYIKDGW